MGKTNKERGSFTNPLYCLLLFAVVTVAVAWVRRFDIPYGSILIPALWGMGAILPLRAADTDLLTLGFTPPQFIKGLKYFILSSVVVFPLYSGVFYASLYLGFTVPAGLIAPGTSIFNWIIYNFIAVAFFEELFFRGYLQGRLAEYAKSSFIGARKVFWLPVVAAAFLFALAHVAVDLDPARMAVFFPGLLFGWLRAKTGFLLAPILSHGCANVLSMLLISSGS
ncbi:CPBP family glutamic-type intramembrane protease [bacterium]|nr:CPBP family glutamic-type intramembrane protease [bacterium]